MPNTLERFYAHQGACDYPVLFIKEAASQSFKAGDLLTLSGGKVAIFGTDNSDVTSATGKCVGMALKDASGVTDTLIPVVPATEQTWFMLGAYNATVATAKPASINLGDQTTLRRQGGVHGVNVPAAGSNQNVVVMSKNAETEQEKYGPVWVRFTSAARYF